VNYEKEANPLIEEYLPKAREEELSQFTLSGTGRGRVTKQIMHLLNAFKTKKNETGRPNNKLVGAKYYNYKERVATSK